MPILYLLLIIFISAVPASTKLSLQETQRMALEFSEKASISDLQLGLEKDKVDEVRAIAYPSLKFHADFILAGGAHNFWKDTKKANAKASLIVPIYSFGGASNAIEAQKIQYESSIQDNIRVKQEVIFNVSKAYYKLLEAKQIRNVVRESIAKLKEQLRVSKDFFSEGLKHKNDVTLIEVQLAEREEDYIRAMDNIAIAVASLNRLIGLPLDEPTDIEDVSEDVHFDTPLETYIEQACSCHPALSSLQSQIQSAYYSYKAQVGALYPSIYAFGNYSTTTDYSVPYIHGVDVGLSLQVNLYDGGATSAKIRQKKKKYEELHWKYTSQERDIELAVRSAYLGLQGAYSRIPLTKKNIKKAEDSLKTAQEQYQEGLITSYDLLKNEEDLAEAKSNYYQSLYDFHKAESELLFAAGIINEKGPICIELE
jgi:outer membrane protein TolC